MALVGAIVCLTTGATAQAWSDDFESYTPGSNMDGQGGWRQWNCGSSPDSVCSDLVGNSGTQSLEVKNSSDLVYEFPTPFDSGQWVIRAQQYIFSSGPNQLKPGDWTWFIVMNQYGCAGASLRWSLELRANRATNQFEFASGPNGGQGATLIMDQWVEIRVEIDLDTDTAQVYYDGNALGNSFQWSTGTNGAAGTATIAAIDLWGPTSGTDSMSYWDDVSILPRDTDVAVYCTAKSPLVCGLPAIGASGVSSATASSGFDVFSGPARQNRSGLFVYSDAGRAAIAFQGGLLCVQPSPLRRSCPVSSGGTNPCNGEFRLDFNSFTQGLCGGNPAPFLLTPGQQVNLQTWGRDSVATGSFLSDAVEWSIGP